MWCMPNPCEPGWRLLKSLARYLRAHPMMILQFQFGRLMVFLQCPVGSPGTAAQSKEHATAWGRRLGTRFDRRQDDGRDRHELLRSKGSCHEARRGQGSSLEDEDAWAPGSRRSRAGSCAQDRWRDQPGGLVHGMLRWRAPSTVIERPMCRTRAQTCAVQGGVRPYGPRPHVPLHMCHNTRSKTRTDSDGVRAQAMARAEQKLPQKVGHSCQELAKLGRLMA